jgi:hypothetical protein
MTFPSSELPLDPFALALLLLLLAGAGRPSPVPVLATDPSEPMAAGPQLRFDLDPFDDLGEPCGLAAAPLPFARGADPAPVEGGKRCEGMGVLGLMAEMSSSGILEMVSMHLKSGIPVTSDSRCARTFLLLAPPLLLDPLLPLLSGVPPF